MREKNYIKNKKMNLNKRKVQNNNEKNRIKMKKIDVLKTFANRRTFKCIEIFANNAFS